MLDASELRYLGPAEVEHLAVLAGISRAINATYNVDEALSAALDSIVEALQVGRGCILLATEADGPPRIAVARGIDPRSWLLDAFNYSRTVADSVWVSGESMLSNDAQQDRSLSKIDSLRKLKTRSLMCVPMRVRGQTTGLIYVDNERRANLFTPIDLRLLEVIADLAAAAVERARYYVDLNLQASRPAPTAGLESLGRHARGIAHDFSNVAAIVKAHCDAAHVYLERGRFEDVDASLQRIQTACAQAHALTRMLVTYAEHPDLQPERVDVIRLVHAMEPLLLAVLGPSQELRLRLGAGPLLVQAVPMEVEQIVFNLVMNARNAMTDGGRVTVQSALEVGPPRMLRLTVIDTGIGMNEEAVRCARTPGLGGVGLRLVHEILQRRNGTLAVESTPGVGTRFDVRLPVV